MNELSKKTLLFSLVVATASVVTYMCVKKAQDKKKKNLPVSFI